MKKISVIIPTYKPGDYMWECLESINRQSLDKSAFEVIVILNGCNQPWNDDITTWISKNPGLNVKLIQTDDPGVSNARNIGLDMSRGVYIAFIDDDDFLSENYLKSLLEKANKKNIVVSNVKTYNPSNEEYGMDYISRAYNESAERMSVLRGKSFMSSSCCKLIPKDTIGDFRFNPKIKIGEDSLFMTTISCNIREIIKAEQDCIYYRRLRVDSASRTKKTLTNVLGNKIYLMEQYLKILVNQRYNFLFVASRMAAVTLKGW